jgi:hypothetical protein
MPPTFCTAKTQKRHSILGHHSITSSARASNEGGMSIPSVFAVLRLITQLEFSWLLDRQVAGACSLCNPINVFGGSVKARVIGHQPPSVHPASERKDCAHMMLDREVGSGGKGVTGNLATGPVTARADKMRATADVGAGRDLGWLTWLVTLPHAF